MLSALQEAASDPQALKPSNAMLSDMFGYISFVCWLLVLLPQLYLNYKRKSSEGLSLGFIMMWLAGDFCDWFGAYVGRLLLPAILIALYFVFTDVVLLGQMFCYRKGDEDAFGDSQLPEGAERQPLLVRRGRRACRLSGRNATKRRLAEYQAAEHAVLLDHGIEVEPIATSGPDEDHVRPIMGGKRVKATLVAVLTLVLLVGSGVVTRVVLASYPDDLTDMVSQVFGYMSAALFFVAYIPQIAWNFAAQSTEGLSAGMFIFTVIGNVTYCLSILAYSTEQSYLIAYAPWLFGAAGTLGFELLILWQCYFYSRCCGPNGRDEDDD
ncbi:putative vacuolar membrane transporter for cationic amino acids [Linderina pennispora]|nr:putative vacuolar membrane transporter for cationic amino acids [Linderina pennispora]